MKMLRVHVSTICCSDMLQRRVHLVELHGTRREDKIIPKLVLHNYKSISSHEGTCRFNISLKHVPATFSCVCTCCDLVPATRPCYIPPQCALHKFFVAATCRCNMTLRVCPPLESFSNDKDDGNEKVTNLHI